MKNYYYLKDTSHKFFFLHSLPYQYLNLSGLYRTCYPNQSLRNISLVLKLIYIHSSRLLKEGFCVLRQPGNRDKY